MARKITLGTSAADIITGTAVDDRIEGLGGNDQLNGGDGSDELLGGAGNDRLYGGNGNDWLYGGIGNDTLAGEAGDDQIFGEDGNDGVYGGGGNDTIFGGAGIDTLYGDGGDDLIDGGIGADVLWGGVGNDSLTGGDGDDRLSGDAGDDVLTGGAGLDVAVFSGRLADYVVTVRANGTTTIADQRGIDGTDTFSTIENFQFADQTATLSAILANATHEIVGTIYADILAGSTGNDAIDGLGGDDTLRGGNGNDIVMGGAGNDTLYGDAGADKLYGGDGSDFLYVGAGDTLADGGAGTDFLMMSAGTDLTTMQLVGIEQVNGTYGNDVIDLRNQTAGFDVYTNGGADVLRGGHGSDLFYITGAAARIEFTGLHTDYTFSVANTGVWKNDIGFWLTDNRIGGDGADHIFDYITGVSTFHFADGDFTLAQMVAGVVGTNGNDQLTGTSGDDRIFGLDGNDVLIGGGGNDLLYGGNGSDQLYGDAGADSFFGGGDNDWISIGAGDIVADGGSGYDTVSLTFGASMATQFINIEAITGTWGDDVIDVSAYTTGFDIYAGGGNDVVRGSHGNDSIDAAGGIVQVDFTGARADYDVTVDASGNLDITDLRAGGDGTDHLSGVANFHFTDGDFTARDLMGVGAGPSELADTLIGTMGDDVIDGLGGDDTIDGGIGNDQLSGSAGNDWISGGDGDDILSGGDGANYIDGGDGLDTLSLAGARADYLVTQDNYGMLHIGTSYGEDNYVNGVEAFVFSDMTVTQAGIMFLQGEPTMGDDVIVDQAGQNSVIDGLAGDDLIDGGDGHDFLIGGEGNDLIRGGLGDDILAGGAGQDTFLWTHQDTAHDWYSSASYDVVTDFEVGQDVIAIESLSGTPFTIEDYGNGALVVLSDGAGISAAIMIENVHAADLTPASFVDWPLF